MERPDGCSDLSTGSVGPAALGCDTAEERERRTWLIGAACLTRIPRFEMLKAAASCICAGAAGGRAAVFEVILQPGHLGIPARLPERSAGARASPGCMAAAPWGSQLIAARHRSAEQSRVVRRALTAGCRLFSAAFPEGQVSGA